MIYIIGDSHVSVFSGTDKTHDNLRHIQPEFGTCYTLSGGQLRSPINRFEQKIPYFCPIKTGSNTAWNSYDKLPIIEQAISEYKVSKDDYVFTCFGEIDIRNHIGFNIGESQTVFDVIKETVNRYMVTVLHLKDKGINVGVYGPPASSIGWSTSGRQYKDVIFRNNMTAHFNEYLKHKCDENNIPFKDISKKMMLADGSTDSKYIMDDIHLSQEAMPLLQEEFNDIICKMEDKK